MQTDMPEFKSLSLNDTDMPIIYNIGFNNTNISKSIEEVLLNIYTNENHNITFEELSKRIIDFYFNEASEECIEDHLEKILSDLHPSTSAYLLETIMYDKYTNEKEYNLIAIKAFVKISFGKSYLYDIFSRI